MRRLRCLSWRTSDNQHPKAATVNVNSILLQISQAALARHERWAGLATRHGLNVAVTVVSAFNRTGQVFPEKATFGGYLIAHAKIAKNGKHVNIIVNGDGHYFWDIDTLHVSHCPLHTSLVCGGYGALGNEHWINGLGSPDEMNVGIRAIDDLAHVSPLVWPLVTPYQLGLQLHFSWTNVGPLDQKPVCGSTYLYKEDYSSITQPFEDEVFCIETDLKASTVWRFAHTRASVELSYFHTQPVGSVSQDGHFYLFTSGWDEQVGYGANGTPRSDVWIVNLR